MSRRLVFISLVALIVVVGAYLAYATWFASRSDGPTVLYFHADTCPYCKEMTPIVDQIRRQYGGRVEFVYVDVSQDEGERLGREHGVIGTPTLVLLDSEGQQTNVLRGTFPKSVLEQAISDLVE